MNMSEALATAFRAMYPTLEIILERMKKRDEEAEDPILAATRAEIESEK